MSVSKTSKVFLVQHGFVLPNKTSGRATSLAPSGPHLVVDNKTLPRMKTDGMNVLFKVACWEGRAWRGRLWPVNLCSQGEFKAGLFGFSGVTWKTKTCHLVNVWFKLEKYITREYFQHQGKNLGGKSTRLSGLWAQKGTCLAYSVLYGTTKQEKEIDK